MIFKNQKTKYKSFNMLGIALIIYELIFQISASVFISLDISPGHAMGISATMAVIFMLIFENPGKLKKESFKTLNPGLFIHIMLIFIGTSKLSQFLIIPIENLCAYLGLSLDNMAENAYGINLEAGELFYALLIAPIIEEITYRYCIFNRSIKYGFSFAAIVSSAFFAIMHLNIIQLIPAFCLGLMLAFIRYNYGLKYSILIHILNNSISVLPAFTMNYPFIIIILLCLILISLIYTLYTAFRRANFICIFLKDISLSKIYFKAFIKSPGIIIFFLLFFAMLILSIS